MSHLRTYSELIRLETFSERFDYLSLKGEVGAETFGWERHLNQTFYKSYEWKRIRRMVIARDLGFDLAIDDIPIKDRPIIHHMNPMDSSDLYDRNPDILNPEFLITTSHLTHNAIHYGSTAPSSFELVERRPGDTKLW